MSPVLLWFLIGIAFFVTELALPGFIVFFFGLGAWCAALALYFFDPPLSGQLSIFLAASLLSLFLLRSLLRDLLIGSSQEQDDSVNMMSTSSTGVVTEDILPPARGTVQYGGTFWQAEADLNITTGSIVTIVEQNNLLVKVQPATKEED
jgi:membrane protein implicated in regulation of membrane protease activity